MPSMFASTSNSLVATRGDVLDRPRKKMSFGPCHFFLEGYYFGLKKSIIGLK
jgi:hypothetical protein